MPCYDPRPAFSYSKTLLGKNKWCFSKRLQPGQPLPSDTDRCKWTYLPCGQCIGCRITRTRDWSLRCIHESKQYKQNSFITLTYSDSKLPPNGNLEPKHLQKFMKDLRALLCSKGRKPAVRRSSRGLRYVPKIRFFASGEYGEKFSRPHYHAIIFGYSWPDKKQINRPGPHKYYRSKTLEALWPHGFSEISDLSVDSAAYVAGYVLKKITGPASRDHYEKLDEFGEYRPVEKEFSRMSRKPGIARAWFDQFARSDCYNKDYVTVGGKEFRPPKYYDRLYEIAYPTDMLKLKEQRKANALEAEARAAEIDGYVDRWERLKNKETIAKLNLQKKKRAYET